MKIRLRRWGGFTGRAGAEEYAVDVDSLPPHDASGLRALVQAAGFFSLPAKIAKAAPQPWDFQHSLEIEDGARTHTVQFHADAAPVALNELARAVETRASRA